MGSPSQHHVSDIQEEAYIEGLAHIIIKVENSHDFLSASWQSRNVGGVVSVQA